MNQAVSAHRMLNSIEDGSKALLKDAATVLLKFPELNYMVIGGWCPVLRNKTKIRHPGTLDVDLLFRDSYRTGNINGVISSFLEAGFCPSAKHPFQLMKSQTIKDKNFIFNIDLLHPNMINDKKTFGLFVDHLDLDVPLGNNEIETRRMKSIVLPNSDVLFSEGLFSRESIESVEFNLVSFDGMFVTKMDSCQKQKRARDSFDIYLGFLGKCIDVFRLKNLAEKDERISSSIYAFSSYLRNKSAEFNDNVKMFCDQCNDSPANFVLRCLDEAKISQSGAK